jgi:predicted DNA binding CopG/RHH family protein
LVGQNLAQLNTPSIGDPAAVDSTTELYESITSIAPLAVKPEWETMTSTVEAASTVDPNNPESVQKVADMARSSQHAAATIADYTSKVCGITLAAPTTTLAVVETTTTTTG